MTTKRHFLPTVALALLLGLVSAPVAAATSVSYLQTGDIVVSANAASDVGWIEQCPAGTAPYTFSISVDLTKLGNVLIPRRMYVPADGVIERRGTNIEVGLGGIRQSAALPPSRPWGNPQTLPPLMIEGELRVCGLRKQFFVVDTVLHISGHIGAWSVQETIKGTTHRTKGGLDLRRSLFSAQLVGVPKYPPLRADINPARVWGVQTASFRFVQPRISSGATTGRLKGDINLYLRLLVVE